jgi:hypothetical protein
MKKLGSSLLGFIACVLALCLLQGCGPTLPSDFASRSLDEKISIYEHYIKKRGHPSTIAQTWISWHGFPTADAMALYLTDQREGLPKPEAIEIIQAVQLRGCSLRGTIAQKALESYLAKTPEPDPYGARSTLTMIIEDLHVSKYDTLPPGPCNEQK